MKTVKVRIAVAVNEDGEWSAYGFDRAKPGMAEDVVMEAMDSAPGPLHIVYIEAEIPTELPIVKGTVSNG